MTLTIGAWHARAMSNPERFSLVYGAQVIAARTIVDDGLDVVVAEKGDLGKVVYEGGTTTDPFPTVAFARTGRASIVFREDLADVPRGAA